MESVIGTKAFNGMDEAVWNHTFVITTERLVVGNGVLIMIFDQQAQLKWSGKDTSEGNGPGKPGKPISPGDNVVVYDATVRFH
ncbi:hypothetical protein PWT90_06659 [Aphanocladium album]|nr:hypothetical protein PWT90_06659 [Aphanocladium album]